jgi:hypothetical protein
VVAREQRHGGDVRDDFKQPVETVPRHIDAWQKRGDGGPVPLVQYHGATYTIGQANNAR